MLDKQSGMAYSGARMKKVFVQLKQPEFDILLARKNVAKQQVASSIGVSPSSITRICSGDPVSARMRRVLIEYLGCAFEDIFLIRGSR